MSETRTYNNTICQVYNNQNTILFKWSAINPTRSSIKEHYVVITQFSAALVKCIESVNNLLKCLRSYQKNNINLYHCLSVCRNVSILQFTNRLYYNNMLNCILLFINHKLFTVLWCHICLSSVNI